MIIPGNTYKHYALNIYVMVVKIQHTKYGIIVHCVNIDNTSQTYGLIDEMFVGSFYKCDYNLVQYV